jgi:molybdopterin synthase catalytic subunit
LIKAAVQEADFDVGAELAALVAAGIGGVASFIGVVRAAEQGARRVCALTLEHYPGMTEKALAAIATEATARWELAGVTVLHRVGRLEPGQNIVFVAAASAHREAALQATAFLIDWLKTKAPFWKLEEYEDGGREWVAARSEDEDSAQRWGQAEG